MKRVVSVIQQNDTTEVQWGKEEPVNGKIEGYMLILGDGTLCVPFRDLNDEPYVFVLDYDGASIHRSEDSPPDLKENVMWSRRR